MADYLGVTFSFMLLLAAKLGKIRDIYKYFSTHSRNSPPPPFPVCKEKLPKFNTSGLVILEK